MLDLWPQAESPGVTHIGAYHRPPDGHFYIVIIIVIVHWFIAAHLWKQLFSGKVTANAFSSAPAKQQDNNIDIFLRHFLN